MEREIPGEPLYSFTMDGGGSGDAPDSMVAVFTASSETVDVKITTGGRRDVHIMGYALFLLTESPRGDVNLDSVVDLDDFGLFKTDFGDFAGCPTCELTGDVMIGLDDINVHKANFGARVPVSAVPEAEGFLMALLGVVGSLAAVRRSHTS